MYEKQRIDVSLPLSTSFPLPLEINKIFFKNSKKDTFGGKFIALGAYIYIYIYLKKLKLMK